MKKIGTSAALIAVALFTSAAHCPPKPDENPYDVARGYVQAAQFGLVVADGLFETWAAHADPAKVAAVRPTYAKVKAAVVNGLRLALDAIAIAEQASKPVDINALLAQAETAFQDLRKLIADLTAAPASTRPAAAAKAEKYPGFKLEDLPLTLLPVKAK